MAKAINNMDDLAIALQPTMKKMVDGMANRVYETLNFFLQRYYDSYDPIYYRRQYDFLRSGFKVDARIVRGKAVASVYIDVDYMSNYYGVDHIIPIAMNGDDNVKNLQCTCEACNKFKGSALPQDFWNRITEIFTYQTETKTRHPFVWKITCRLLKLCIE